jgi:hypothetical protein
MRESVSSGSCFCSYIFFSYLNTLCFESRHLQHVRVLQPNSAVMTYFFFKNVFLLFHLCFFKILWKILLEFYYMYIREHFELVQGKIYISCGRNRHYSWIW